MSAKIERFFVKHSFEPQDIKYIIREDKKTAIHLLDGRVIQTYNTIKEFRETLSRDDFLHPNKGVLAALSQVVAVHDGGYEMADGRIFKYRVHNTEQHDRRMLMLGRRMEQQEEHAPLDPSNLCERFSVMDRMPLGVCVIELKFNTQNLSAVFLIRYCNKAMLDFEHMDNEDVQDLSFTEVFPDADPKLIIAYADVAANGSTRVVDGYVKRLEKSVKFYCYQPLEGYCACMMMVDD